MAVVTTVSNHCAYMIGTKKIDFSADTFIAILMNTTFAFDKDTHATYADVSASELATNYGYTQKSKTMTGVSVTEDDTVNGLVVTWDDVTWTASGGTIGPSGAMIVIDDTTTDDTVIMCVDFGTDLSATDGTNLTVETVKFQGLTA